VKGGKKIMGKIIEKVKMWNIIEDEEKVERGEEESLEIEAQIDDGATTPIITPQIVEILKLRKSEKTRVKYANERIEEREVAISLRISIMGRNTVCRAVIEPKRELPLLGQIVLEDLDLWRDSKNGRLVPNPESPDMPLLKEI
jgi:clan AA aspartic protease